jgi:mono/diheme cytochrome c family protein
MTNAAARAIGLVFIAAIAAHGQSAPAEADIAAGQKLFMRHCSECHGHDGTGTERAPSLVSYVRNAEAGMIQSFIKNGNLRRGMPSWSKLPDQRLSQIVAYLKSLRSSEIETPE